MVWVPAAGAESTLPPEWLSKAPTLVWPGRQWELWNTQSHYFIIKTRVTNLESLSKSEQLKQWLKCWVYVTVKWSRGIFYSDWIKSRNNQQTVVEFCHWRFQHVFNYRNPRAGSLGDPLSSSERRSSEKFIVLSNYTDQERKNGKKLHCSLIPNSYYTLLLYK